MNVLWNEREAAGLDKTKTYGMLLSEKIQQSHMYKFEDQQFGAGS